MAVKNGRRSGFFFAVMALAMLSLVLLTVQVWVKTFEQGDYRASQRFKGEAMRAIMGAVSDEALSDFANASAFYATYRLAGYTADLTNGGLAWLPGSDEAANPHTGAVERAAVELMLNGSSEPNAGKMIEYSEDERNAYTIAAWQNMTDAAANVMGFDIEFSEPRGIRYSQADAWTIAVEFEVDMNITDAEGTMRQNRTMRAASNFSIAGFLDPSITRNDMAHRGIERGAATEKQVFRHEEYGAPGDVAPSVVDSNGPEGNGWFFGPITYDYPNASGNASAADPARLKQYILVHKYDGDLPAYADLFGAVIVTTAPGTNVSGCVETQTGCLNCMRREIGGQGCPPAGGWELFPPHNNPASVPVIVASNDFHSNLTNVPEVKFAREGEEPFSEQYVLIDNEHESPGMKTAGYHRIWDITSLRDMAICGFYVKGAGPSFLQRMLANSQGIRNNALGIESFVVGKWAGGADDKANGYGADLYSRLDWEFYSAAGGPDVPKIKGMMGCKGKGMCASVNATEISVGHFRLSDDAVGRYMAGGIACPQGSQASPCE